MNKVEDHSQSLLSDSLLRGLRKLVEANSERSAVPFRKLADLMTVDGIEYQVVSDWVVDGVAGELLEWDCGYGPKTRAALLRPKTGVLRGAVLVLHDHAGFKFAGYQKVASSPTAPHPALTDFIAESYDGRLFADDLARMGFLVMAHDVFLWGSRRFPVDEMAAWDRSMGLRLAEVNGNSDCEVAVYNAQSHFAEITVAKALMLPGLDLASVVHFEDLVACRILRQIAARLPFAVVGHSGGGLRAAMLKSQPGTADAFAISGMMTTDAGLNLDNVAGHTWMFFPRREGWLRDWTDSVLQETDSQLLVVSYLDDELFTTDGMTAADAIIRTRYESGSGVYESAFLPGPHHFGLEAQQRVGNWLSNFKITSS